FDRGIDVVSPETNERVSRVEDERVREINFIKYDRGQGRMLAATSRGLVIFDDQARETVLTRERDGLISDSVAHISLAEAPFEAGRGAGAAASSGPAVVLATAGGLTEILGGRARSINAFHGLSSNHLYCTATAGPRLFVGSLAGLAEIEGLRVVRTYKTS